MELITTLLILLLLMLAGLIQNSDATYCTLHVTSQSPMMINLSCPNSMCQLELQTPRGSDCYTNTPNCYIDDCNKVYTICNVSQNQPSESSPRCRELSSGSQTVYSNEQPINCTLSVLISPSLILIRLACSKGECNHTAISSNTECSRELGMEDCAQGDHGCERLYSLYITTETPTSTSQPITSTSGMTCTCSECINTATIHPVKSIYVPTTVYLSVCPSSTTELTSKTIETTNMLGFPTNSYPASSSVYPPDSKSAIMLPTLIISATGALVGLLIILLLVIITGWICTCRILKKRGKMEINMMQDSFPNRPCINGDRQTYTVTQTRLDNPLCEGQQQSTCVPPPSTKPKPPERQREEPVYAISLVTHRRDSEEPKNIQNRPNHVLSRGGVSVGGATPVQKKQAEIEHKYDRLVKVVKQTERGQSMRDETISLERNHKHQTVNKQEKDTTHHIQDYLTSIKQETKSFQNRPYKALLPDGGASVGVTTQFPPRKQGELEHQYDHLIEVGKQKGGQSERVDGEIVDHGYHVLEGPDNDYDDLDEQERETVHHILDGPTPLEPELKTFQNGHKKVFPVGGVSVGGATQFTRKQKACEHQYDHLVKKKGGQYERDVRADEERDHGYHVLEGLGVDDYDYPDEHEGEIVYHVLDGPTPVEEETQFTY